MLNNTISQYTKLWVSTESSPAGLLRWLLQGQIVVVQCMPTWEVFCEQHSNTTFEGDHLQRIHTQAVAPSSCKDHCSQDEGGTLVNSQNKVWNQDVTLW